MTDPTTIGRYRIVNRLGHGGMGALFLAHDPVIDRMVAIKVMREGVDSAELRERFAREARAAGRLRHPNIVTIFDVGEDRGQPFIAMEYVPGETLEGMIQRRSRLALTRKLKIIEELCDGLGYAHKAAIVHRDIKPANLMLDADGMLKILDFGIVRFAQSGMTQAGMLVGTLSYMSPEQVAGKPIDHRSDIFAVGDVAYELLSGKQAFPGNLQDGIMNRILHSAPKPLEELCPGLDPEIARIVSRALEKEPADRYQDLVRMRRDLARVRERLEEEEEGEESAIDDGSAETVVAGARRPKKPDSSAGATPRPPTDGADPRATGRREVELRRQARIQQYLEAAERALESGDFDVAIASADDAALIDPSNERALDIIDRAQAAREEQQVHAWLNEAREHLNRGDATQAAGLLEQARALRPTSTEIRAMQQTIDEVRRELELARERAQIVREAVGRARADLAAGAFEMAVRAANEALARQSQHTEALEIRQQALAALEEQRKRQEHERAAAAAIDAARRLFEAERHEEAIETLARFQPPHTDVSRLLGDFRQKAVEIRRRREEEEREALRRKIAALTAAAQQAADAGRYDEAIGLLDRVRELDPQSDAASQLMRRVVDLKTRADAAARIRAEIEQKLNQAASLLEQDDIAGAVRLRAQALQLDSENSAAREFEPAIERRADALLSAASKASDQKDYDRSVEIATRVRALSSRASAADQLVRETVRRKGAAEAAERTRALVAGKVSAAAAALTRDELRAAAGLYEEARALDAESAMVAELGQSLRDRVERLLADARQAFEHARFDEALGFIQQIREIDPASSAADTLQGTIAEQQAADEAAARTRSVFEQNLAQASAALQRGELALAARIQQEAVGLDAADSRIAALGSEIARRRAVVEAHVSAAQAAIERRDFNAALEEIDRARKIDSQSPALDRLAQDASAGLAVREREERRRKQFEETLATAAARLDGGALDEALRLADQALGLDAASADARALRQRVQQALDARAEQQRLEAERKAREARVAKALDKARKTRSHDQGIRILREALEIDAANEDLLAVVGERERAQAAERARAEEEQRESERRARDAKINKALARARKIRSHDEALRVLREILSTEPGHPAVLEAIRDREAAFERENAPRVAAAARASRDAVVAGDLERAPAATVRWHGKWLIAVGGGLIAVLALSVGVWKMRGVQRPQEPPASVTTTQAAPESGTGRVTQAESTPSTSAAVTPEPAPAPPEEETKEPQSANSVTGEDLERQLQPFRERARLALVRGQTLQAFTTAQNGLNLKGDDQALRAILSDVASKASEEATAARGEAEKSGAPSTASALYQQAVRQQRDALTERSAGRHAAAARGLWAARDTFGKAADEGRRIAAAEAERLKAQQAIAQRQRNESGSPPASVDLPRPSPATSAGMPSAATGPPPTPPGSTARPETSVPNPAPKPSESASPPRSSPVVDERGAIQQAIRTYEAAYNSKDVEAVRRVQMLSRDEARVLDQTFSQAREYQVSVAIDGITVLPNGKATVTASVRRIFDPKAGGNRRDMTTDMLFNMEKRGTSWIVAGVKVR